MLLLAEDAKARSSHWVLRCGKATVHTPCRTSKCPYGCGLTDLHWEVSHTEGTNGGSATPSSTSTAVVCNKLLCQLQSEVLDGLLGGVWAVVLL